MGRTKLVKYRVEEFHSTHVSKFAYQGRLPANKQAMEDFVMAGVVSTFPGYVNEAMGKRYGLRIPSKVVIVDQKKNVVVREWEAPMFMVLPRPEDYPKVVKTSDMLAQFNQRAQG